MFSGSIQLLVARFVHLPVRLFSLSGALTYARCMRTSTLVHLEPLACLHGRVGRTTQVADALCHLLSDSGINMSERGCQPKCSWSWPSRAACTWVTWMIHVLPTCPVLSTCHVLTACIDGVFSSYPPVIHDGCLFGLGLLNVYKNQLYL